MFTQITAFLDAGTSTAFFNKIWAKTHRIELIKYYGLVSLVILMLLYSGIKVIYFNSLNEAIFPHFKKE